MLLKDFFEEFEKKYDVKLNTFQKRTFLTIVKTQREDNIIYIHGLRNGKTLLAKMLIEYYKKGEKK